MNPITRVLSRFGGGLLILAVLLAGCSRQPETGTKETAKTGDAAHPAEEAQRDPNRLYCEEHKAYEDECFICHAELREAGRLWCAEHSRYEDRCWLCHPELEDKTRLFCNEHSLYEDECFLCHPELKTKSQAAAPATPVGLMCQEHGLPEAECGMCHLDLVATADPDHAMKVRMPSPESAAKAGVTTTPAEAGPMTDGLEAYGEIVFNQNRLAQIVAPVGGILQTVEVDLGARVGEGQIVARLWSATITEATAKVVLARQTLERERKLYDDGLSPERDLQEAEAAYYTASQQLQTLGFDEQQIAQLSDKPRDAALLELRAPFAGEIVERNAVRGVLVEPGASLFTLADRRVVWVELQIPESQLFRVREGQTVQLTVESLPGETFIGKLTWISAEVDERTRMALARAEVPNADGRLKAAMFARARILTSSAATVLVIPETAVQRIDGSPVVFVRIENDLFDVRPVRLGSNHHGDQVVLAGLYPGDPIVVTGSYVMKSQLLISRLGAGCCVVE